MLLVEFDGVPLGKTNFVPMDSLGRIWFTVTRLHPWTRSIDERAADGYVGPAPMMASVTFGGPDLHTVYLGSLMGTTIPSFRSPVRGLPLPHWKPAVGRR